MKMWSNATLVELMNRRQMKTTRLATRVGCSPAMISHLRTARHDGCKDSLARRIAEALEVPVDALFDLTTATDDSPISDLKEPA